MLQYLLLINLQDFIQMDPQKNQSQKHDVNNHSQDLNIISQHLVQVAQKQLSMTGQQLETLMNQDIVDRLLGCLFGAFIGDSLGSFCEFQNKSQSTKNIVKGMEMPGGGPFMLHPGQVTDDSQMALHMMIGLLKYTPSVPLSNQIHLLLVAIGKQYIKWVENIPFDIGFTCRSAISQLEQFINSNTQSLQNNESVQLEYNQLLKAFQRVTQVNQSSLSNGFLMRLTPMVCFATLIKKYSSKDFVSLEQLIKGECNMTHSNKKCIEASNIYIDVISKLILRKDFESISQLKNEYSYRYQQVQQSDVIGSAIKQAFQIQKTPNKELMCATKSAGFFKIAYYYTFFALGYIAENYKSDNSIDSEVFKHLLKFTIQQGGDTDTNACIVGGLVGSIVGFKKLPAEYLRKQLTLKLTSQYRSNTQTYEPINGFINLMKLIKKFR